jgi:hypothetical protein
MRVAIIVLLLSTSAFTQMRGGARMGFGGGRGFGGGHIVHHGGPAVFFNPGFNQPLGIIPQAGRPFFPGVPASVTSLGPCGFTPCFFNHGFRHFGFSPFFGNGFFGGGFPVAVPVPIYTDYAAYSQPQVGYAGYPQPQVMVQQPSEPQRLEVTIVDRRSEKENESNPVEAAPKSPKPHDDDPGPPTTPAIFVFKDGTQKELANYAIMRGQLIDVSDGKIFRIPLENIDREKTLDANAKAGREIALP